MGAVSELIKAAEEKQAVSPASMMQQLTDLQQRASQVPPASAALGALSQKVPTASEESKRKALKWIAIAGLGSLGVGALLRALRSGTAGTTQSITDDADPYAGMPGREITIPLPHMAKKSAVAIPAAVIAAAAPSAARAAGSSVGGLWERLKGGVGEGVEHLFAPTGSPFDNPWFLPAALAAGLGGGYVGYSQLDKLLEKRRKSRMQRQIEAAKQEFEDALKTQYRQSELLEGIGKSKPKSLPEPEGNFKFSAAGMMGVVADAFAQSHVAGELAKQFESLEKEAQMPEDQQGFGWQSFKGAGRKAMGAYLAALALLTAAGGAAGYSLVKSREGKRLKHEAARDVLRRRAVGTPPTVTVEPA